MPKGKARPPLTPFALSVFLIVLDQVTKHIVASSIKLNRIGFKAMGDFFWLVHQQNTGAAFSMADRVPPLVRVGLLILVPLGLMIALAVYYFKTDELSKVQRWALCGILGGGLGNLIDRVWRPGGVVDFLSFKFYGLFGLERWPTFNVADMSIVVGGILLVVAGFFVSSPAKGREGGTA